MKKKLYRIIDADPVEAETTLRFDPTTDVVEVEYANGNFTTFHVWLEPNQIEALANSNLNYEKL